MLAIVNNYCANLSINKKRYNLRICRYAGEIPYFYQFIPFKKAPKSLLFFTLDFAELGTNTILANFNSGKGLDMIFQANKKPLKWSF